MFTPVLDSYPCSDSVRQELSGDYGVPSIELSVVQVSEQSFAVFGPATAIGRFRGGAEGAAGCGSPFFLYFQKVLRFCF